MEHRCVLVAMAFLGALLGGCGDSSDDLNGLTDPLLSGSWQTNCFFVQIFNTNFTEDGIDTLYSGDVYEDACVTPYYDVDYLTDYESVGAAVVAGYPNARKINFLIKSVLVTPRSAKAVTDFNTEATCGQTDWSLAVAKEIALLDCSASAILNGRAYAQGAILHGIYDVNGTVLTQKVDPSLSGIDYPTAFGDGSEGTLVFNKL